MLKLLLSLFKKCPLIDNYKITNSYNVVFCKFLSVRKYGYSNLEQIYNVLGIFNEEHTNVSISCPKCSEPFLQPLLQKPQSSLAVAFEKINVFKPEVLC